MLREFRHVRIPVLRQTDGSLAFAVGKRRVGPGGEERPGDVEAIVLHRIMERRASIEALLVGIGAQLDECCNCLRLASAGNIAQ